MADHGWCKVVAHYVDGTLLKGETEDFDLSSESFHIVDVDGNARPVFVNELKALFFVRNLDGNPNYRERKGFHGQPQKGHKVMVEFFDGELMFGFTHVSYTHHGPGFFMFPGDPNANNLKVFVVRAATKRVKVRDLETQKEEVFS